MSANTPYELIYFKGPGRAFISRCMFKIAGVSYTNTYPEWPADKPKMPYGRLPVLHVTNSDGSKLTLCESTVIERYIAHKYGFLPKDPEESATLEMYIAQMQDSIESYVHLHESGNSEEAKQKLAKTLEYLLEKHESILSRSKSGYYYKDQITLVDLYMYTVHYCISSVDNKEIDLFAKMEIPNIQKLLKLVDANPSVQAVKTND